MNTDTATGLDKIPGTILARNEAGRARQEPGDARLATPPAGRYLRMPSVSMTLRYLFRFSDFR